MDPDIYTAFLSAIHISMYARYQQARITENCYSISLKAKIICSIEFGAIRSPIKSLP